MDTIESEELEKVTETSPVCSDPETSVNETSDTNVNDPTKEECDQTTPQALSPKVSRPKLPDFKENGQIRSPGHHGRAKTDPGQGSEIKAIIDKTVEDIKELNQVEFTKIYSRPKKFPKPFPQKSRSTHASPRASPTPGSPCVDESVPSLNRNRSRSLKILTDILKGGRGGADYRLGNIPKVGKDDGTAKSISDSQLVPRKPSLVKEEESERRSSSDGQLQTNRNIEKNQVSNSSSTQDSGTGDSSADKTSTSTPEVPSPIDDKVPHSPNKKRAFTKFRRAKSEVPKISTLSDDEGVGITESDQENPPLSSQKPYHTIDTNSQFFKIWKTGTSKRRSGFSSLVHTMYRPGTHAYGDDSLKVDDQHHGCRKLHRVELKPIPTGRKTSQPRHATHPPNPKTTFREEGAMDTNGFGSVLKSPSTESPPPFPGPFEQKTSDLSLTDSQFSQSDYGDDSIFPNKECPPTQEPANSCDKPPERKNGKQTKQKSRSDPSGNKSKDNVNLPHVVSTSHSSPILSRSSEDEGDTESTLKNEDTEGEEESSKASLIRSPSNSFDEGQPLHFEVSEGGRSSLTPEVTDDDQGSVGMEMPTSGVRYTTVLYPEISGMSSTSTNTEKSQNYLEVPSPQNKKTVIGRSASTASVLQRKFSGQTKEEIRKHSLTTGEDSVAECKPELVPLADTTIQSTSMPSLNKNGQYKDKRYHIVEELYRNEQEYVEALTVLKDKYMLPLKTSCTSVDESLVDNIFYMIPEILMHHTVYRNCLDKVWSNWDTKKSTIGNLIVATFSKQTVIDCYLSFVENYKTSGKVIENALQTKSSVQKFIEQCHKESGSKLTMKDLIVRPIQRIPRYELLLQRLIEHTTREHPDFLLLKDAEKVMHDFAIKLETVNESQHEEDQLESLKRLELLLLTDLAVPDRQYLKHDMVQILTKKDQCCLWLFSDLILFSSLKRRTGPVPRKVSIILKSPTGQDFAENIKHKVWLKVGLDAVEIVKSQAALARRNTVDPEQLERDINILNDVDDLSSKLSCSHSSLDDVVKEMLSSLNKQLSEIMVQSPSIDSNKLDILVTTQEGIYPLEIVFNSGEKRGIWESTFLDAKQKLSLMSDKRAPEFLQPLQITKTRAGMQFSCAAPIDGLNASGFRDVWVCNSDGYVGHMCLLSLQPEPIVTLNTPVPGCNARILCICAVPAYSGTFRRKSSGKKVKHPVIPPVKEDPQKIHPEEADENTEEEDGSQAEEEGYQTDSESSDEEEEEEDNQFSEKPEAAVTEALDIEVKRTPISEFTRSSPDPITLSGNWTRDPHKSTMWLGTEDGCIHIFQCTDNIKTTKNKLKIHHESPVYCIVYLDNKVFVSLANGDLIVYKRDIDGIWDSENPYTRTIGTVQSPITKMLAVAGKLWCGCQNVMKVINPLTLTIETSFQVTSDSNRCVQCLVCSGQGVWLATQQSSKVLLYHATTYDLLLEVSIAQAVSQKLQSADDIIRQHKAACLRITALLVCKDLLWVGTSAGVILTIPMPRITSTTMRGTISGPSVTGLIYGHTGHVRFLTCVEMTGTASTSPKAEGNEEEIESENLAIPDIHRRSSVAATTATMATRMLVISGGDGYEDFRNNVANESAGRDDSTNHLLLWQV